MCKLFLCVASRGRYNKDGTTSQHFEIRKDAHKYVNTLTTVEKDNYIICKR